MSDLGHELTDAELLKLEQRISEIFEEASADAADIVNEYFENFKLRDEEMRKAVEAGEVTEDEYKQWRLVQIGRGKRWETMRDKLAERMTAANEVAAAYMNDTTPGIYSLNRNYTAYTINQYHPDADFTLWDERTVRRLIVEQPDLMPNYPEERAVERKIDLAFGKRQITAQVTSSILLGDSIPHMADKLQKRIVDMNRTSAIRAARTATTAAECAGRQDTYVAAEKMGIELQKEWMATLDARTRAEHGEADGQVVAVEAPFTVGGEKLMAPGDKEHGASGWNIYNCRCTTVAVIPGIKSSRQTYSEWMAEKKKAEAAAKEVEKSGESGIFRGVNLDPIKITQETIDNVPYVEIPGLGEEVSKAIQNEHKRLLSEAMKLPLGTEAGSVLDMEGRRIWNGVGSQKNYSVNVPNKSVPHIAIHNHPSGEIFSGNDIERFIFQENLQAITVVGNDGSVYALVKSDEYDGFLFGNDYSETLRLLAQYTADNDSQGYVNAIIELLERSEQYGVKKVIRRRDS